jgi:hypothetical protein
MAVVKVALSDLVKREDLYPRTGVDPGHVRALVEAIESGAKLPPIVADKASKAIVDGYHRHAALMMLGVETIDVDLRSYASDAAMFEDAIALNAAHGRRLTNADHSQIVIRARELGVTLERVGTLVGVSPETLERRFLAGQGPTQRIQTPQGTVTRRPLVPLKKTLKHLDGQKLTAVQVQANAKAGGMAQSFYSRQLVMLARADALDLGDQAFVRSLIELRDHLNGADLESFIEEIVAV